MKKYQVIYADPPWEYPKGWPAWGGKGERKPLPYPSMNIQDIRAIPIQSLLKKEAYLFLWTTNRYLEKAFGVVRSWGCTPRQTLTWCKTPHGVGPGGMFSVTTEFLIVSQNIREGTNAHGSRTKRHKINTSWFVADRAEHSRKPDIFRDMIEDTCHGPYLELFAREKHDGWDVWGNEIDSDIELEAK